MVRQVMKSAIDNTAEEKLLDAMEKFNLLSGRLEGRYEELLTETDRLREELRRKEEEIRASAKLAVLGEMAAAIAHEVRNPLGSIKLFLSLLRQDLSGADGPLKTLSNIDKSISALEGVVSNILLFSKKAVSQVCPINIHSIIHETGSDWDRYQSDGLNIKLNLSGNPFLHANESGIRQILNNLILNSAQAIKFDGQVTITCCNGKTDTISLVVQDNGPGISEEIMSRLFEPFVTTKREGTGLGLAIVKQIVTQHGGELSVRNEDGARFEIILPRVQGTGQVNAFKGGSL